MSNVTNADDDYRQLTAYKAGVVIWKVIPPILILFGTVGNTLSILVLTRKSIRTSTTALYLCVLAFSDLVVLYSGLLRQWLIYLFETDVRDVSNVGCKINIWLVYSSLDFSAWILIAVTLERVISSWFPHRARTICTRKSALAFMLSIGIFILGLNAHLLYGMEHQYKNSSDGRLVFEGCFEVNQDYKDFFNHAWPWIDLCAFCAIPFFVIVIGNALILFKVIQSQKRSKSRIIPSVNTGNNGSSNHNRGKNSSMTAMLFTLNVVFLFSTSPISIYNIGYANWADDQSAERAADLDLWWAIVNMFMYTNNSLNFLLYCLSGSRFRKEVMRLLYKVRPGRNDAMNHMPSTYTRTQFAPATSRGNTPDKHDNQTNDRDLGGPSGQCLPMRDLKPGYSGNRLHPDAAAVSTHAPKEMTPVQTVSSVA